MNKFPDSAVEQLKEIVSLLVKADWTSLSETSWCAMVKPEDIARVLSRYDVDLIEHPPGELLPSMDIYPLLDESGWAVDLWLWDIKGKTDLTLHLRVSQEPGNRISLVIEDLRVL